MDEIIQHYDSIMDNQYLITFLELNDSFFKDRNLLISHFGAYVFKVIFSISQQSHRKLILSKLVGLVCKRQELTSFHSSFNTNVTTNALLVIEEITNKWPTEMQSNTNQLLVIIRVLKIKKIN